MAQVITATLSYIWNGLRSLPVFDLGITWAQLMVGMIALTISIWVLRQSFGIGSSVIQKVGRNVRKKKGKQVEE